MNSPVLRLDVASGDAWEAIPHPGPPQSPPAISDLAPTLVRCIQAKRALLAAYTDGRHPVEGITDLLADVRHLCDRLGLEFATLDRTARQNYRKEKNSGR